MLHMFLYVLQREKLKHVAHHTEALNLLQQIYFLKNSADNFTTISF